MPGIGLSDSKSTWLDVGHDGRLTVTSDHSCPGRWYAALVTWSVPALPEVQMKTISLLQRRRVAWLAWKWTTRECSLWKKRWAWIADNELEMIKKCSALENCENTGQPIQDGKWNGKAGFQEEFLSNRHRKVWVSRSRRKARFTSIYIQAL